MVTKNFFERYKPELFFGLITSVVVVVDQILKYLVNVLQPGFTLGTLRFHLVHNTGAGFGILQGQTIWLALISLLVAFGIIYYYKKIPPQKIPQVLFALFLGGVIGNLIDRLFRGYVIDFIDFSFWPAFNIADACITISVIGLIIYFQKGKKN